jgi:hypothetical protein
MHPHKEQNILRRRPEVMSNNNTDNSDTPGGGVVQKDDIQFEKENPNLARTVPGQADTRRKATPDEDASGDSYTGSYPDVVVGSDSATTGTDWGVPQVEDGEQVYTPEGWQSEGEGKGDAGPNRNASGNENET